MQKNSTEIFRFIEQLFMEYKKMQTSDQIQQRLLGAINKIPAIDIHTNISWQAPHSENLWDILGYHYLTEQAFSSGMNREIVAKGRSDEEMIAGVLSFMEAFDNTVQYQWMIDIARDLFDFPHDKLTETNWEELAQLVLTKRKEPGRDNAILEKAAIEKVFVKTSFWESIPEKDSKVFIPVINANDLIFGLDNPKVRKKLKKKAKIALSDSTSVRDAFDEILKYFMQNDCVGACIELPHDFQVFPIVERDFDTAIEKSGGNKPLSAQENVHLQCGALFALAELCNVYGLPVMLKSGAVPDAYRHGMQYGKDLPGADATLRSLLPLFNSFPHLNWCVSVLSESQAQELISYGWLIQNVVVCGHWRYHSIPEYIERNLAARLQSVPKNKLIGYYSDMNKLEFGYAKYKMYRRLLAKVLAEDLVMSGRGNEDDAVNIAGHLLRDNAYSIFDL